MNNLPLQAVYVEVPGNMCYNAPDINTTEQ